MTSSSKTTRTRTFQSEAAALILIGSMSRAASAQDCLCTDRPGLLGPTGIVAQGRLQAELGIPNAVFDRGRGVHTTGINAPLLLRYGLASDFELRLASSTWNYFRDESSSDAETSRGFGDIEIGTKFVVSQNEGIVPRTAIVLGVTLPVGDDDFSVRQPAYNVSFAGSWDLGDGNGLNGLAGLSRVPIGDGDDATTATLGLGLSHSFGGKWGSYVEAVALPGIENAGSQMYAGAGVTYLLTNDVQLDFSGDFGLNSESSDAIVGFGICWRF